MLAAKLHYLL